VPRSIVNTSGTILLVAATSRSGRSTFRDRLLECDHSSDDFTYDLHAGRLAANERRDRTFAPTLIISSRKRPLPQKTTVADVCPRLRLWVRGSVLGLGLWLVLMVRYRVMVRSGGRCPAGANVVDSASDAWSLLAVERL